MDGDRLRKSILEITGRQQPVEAWCAGDRLPWDDPRFSERILAVHLDQDTHMASRSHEVIEKHIAWLVELMERRPDARPHAAGSGYAGARSPEPAPTLHVLDVGCGPGLYCHALARHGFQTTGIDFSPAALRHAVTTAADLGLDCRFLHLDLTALPLDFAQRIGPVDVITFWFGEINSFPPAVTEAMLGKLAACLVPDGLFVVEFQPYDMFPRDDGRDWHVYESSVFSDTPHIWLQENAWDERQQAEINTYWIIDGATGELRRYAHCHQAYPEEQLKQMFATAGLTRPQIHPPISGVSEVFEFPMLVARAG